MLRPRGAHAKGENATGRPEGRPAQEQRNVRAYMPALTSSYIAWSSGSFWMVAWKMPDLM